MNREILFRGKRLDNGEWVHGCLTKYSGHMSYITVDLLKNEVYKVSTETVGQYTGLKDKNGEKIFEGDIVVAFKGEDCEEVNAVFYNANHCKWFLGSPHNNKLPMGLGEFCWLDLEVIGNIHDNPELLEVE